MTRKLGFTLVELLVVIAIISILAAIVVPQVQGHVLRARMTNTEATIRSIETQVVGMLGHANKDNLRQMFIKEDATQPAPLLERPTTRADLHEQVRVWTDIMYILLRQGRYGEAEVNSMAGPNLRLDPEVVKRLGTSYLADLGLDPWGQKYRFYPGPWRNAANPGELPYVPFRSYIPAEENPSTGQVTVYYYNQDRKNILDAKVPGNPPAEGVGQNAAPPWPGIPAPRDYGLYIFSPGVNMQIDQIFAPNPQEDRYLGGGDDINNWDNDRNWQIFYTS